MRKVAPAALLSAALLAGCADAPKAIIGLDAAYVTFATAETGYAGSGEADPAVLSKLIPADTAMHDALKALSGAEASGDNQAMSLALAAAKAEVANVGPLVQAAGWPALTAAFATISADVAQVQTDLGSK